VPDDLRAVFDEDAELYDRARPGYPDALFDDLFTLAGIGAGSRVLEIGCGTGQATMALAERGCAVIAVELGANLARAAARNLAGYPDAQVVVSAFEDWPLPDQPFDAVVAFTAFHWVDQSLGIDKVAGALRSGGAFATVTTDHVAGGTEAFFADVQDCYERWDPATPPGLRLEPAHRIAPATVPDPVGRFGAAELRRYETDIAYSTARYLDVIRTYSPTRALDDERRNGLLTCMGSLIDTRYGGLVVKRYLRQLHVARRTP
jgi:SAM-dependent methyltransferase